MKRTINKTFFIVFAVLFALVLYASNPLKVKAKSCHTKLVDKGVSAMTLPQPQLNIKDGTYNKYFIKLKIKNRKDNITYVYTLNGETPTRKSKVVPKSGIIVEGSKTVKVRAYRNSKKSSVGTHKYVLTKRSGKKSFVSNVAEFKK